VQRWGLIVPEGDEGQRLLKLIQPLVDRREAQQGAPVRVDRVPARMTVPDAQTWRKTAFDNGATMSEELPKYQLILGDLHQVPLAIQQVQAEQGFVGRLAFRKDEDYRAYVEKVLRWEDKPAAERRGDVILHTVRDGTPATEAGYQSLMQPGFALLRGQLETGKLAAGQVRHTGDDAGPSPDGFFDAGATSKPSVLLSLGHGVGAPRGGWKGAQPQLDGQGSLWFGGGDVLRAADFARTSFLPGGLWFMVTCFSAGTPELSAYAHWLKTVGSDAAASILKNLPVDGGRPFINALPLAALANPDGPLGVMGHIDLAWTYSFQELDGGGPVNKPGRYMKLLSMLLKQDRAGIALRELGRAAGQVTGEIAGIYDEEARTGAAPDLVKRGHLWMLRNDLNQYILLGDPAVRIPLASETAKAAAPSSFEALFGFTSTAKPPEAAPPAPTPVPAVAKTTLPLPLDRLEEAIAEVLIGEVGLRAIAQKYGIGRTELLTLASAYGAAGREAVGAGVKEEAIAELLFGELAPKAIAAKYEVDRGALQGQFEQFTAAGRKGIGA
jgi:hypothetical protein